MSRLYQVLLLAVAMLTGCASFMAGYRTPTVRSITLGMTTAGVANVAGQPQRRAALATPNGPVEVWYYVIAGPGGALQEHPIVFANAQVIASGDEAVQALANQSPQEQTAKPPAGGEARQRDEAARRPPSFTSRVKDCASTLDPARPEGYVRAAPCLCRSCSTPQPS